MVKETPEFDGMNTTINVCENCVLKCSYCYEFKKAQSPSEDIKFWTEVSHSKDPVRAGLGKEILEIADYSFANGRDDGASRIITIDQVDRYFDQLLGKDSPYNNDDIARRGLVVDLIGGDALQYPQLLSDIMDLLTYKLYTMDSELAKIARDHWRVSISTNGVPLLRDDVRAVCEKWWEQISLGISIDGCPELHDLNRWLYPDDKRHKIDPVKYPKHIGSWKYIEPSLPFYDKYFKSASLRTKWTVVPSSYKYIMESIKFLHENLGMTNIFFNRAMEDTVLDTPETVKILVEQFKELLEYAVEKLDELEISVLSTYAPRSHIDENTKACGFGNMPCLSVDGDIFSCFRLLNHGTVNTRPYRQGTLDSGILSDKGMLEYLRCNSCILRIKSDTNVYDKYGRDNLMLDCSKCPIIGRCGACTAGCMLNANPTGKKVPFKRTTSNCWFHKVQSVFSLYFIERIGGNITSEDMQVRSMLEMDINKFINMGE